MPETAVTAIMTEIVTKAGRAPVRQGMVDILHTPVSQSGNKDTRIATAISKQETVKTDFLEGRASAATPNARVMIPSALSA